MLSLGGCELGSLSEDVLVGAPPPQSPWPAAGTQAVAEARSPEHARLVGAYGGVYSNSKIEMQVARLVGRLVEASDEPQRSVNVTILNSPAVNAFALPSGDLYITRGLIALANDESELAAVLAHEIAHVTADHARQRQSRAAALAVAKRVSDVVEDPGIRADARQTADLAVASFSQQQELEADEIGVRILARAGFDPFAASRFLTSLSRWARLPALNASTEAGPGFLSSHPSTPSRVTKAREAARQYGAPGLGRQARDQYLRSLDGLLFGDDPREGFVRGREFAHVELGVAFTVPKGFVLKNTSSAVLATDKSNTAIRFDAVAVPDSTPLTDYLASGWVKGLIVPSVRTERIGGLDAAIGSALLEGWSFRIGAIRGPRRVYRFIFASSQSSSTYEEAFRQTMQSFRVLTPSQMSAMRPLRIRLAVAREGDTVGSLAARMRGVPPPVRRNLFEALNGLERGAPVEPGTLLKLVSE